jgi:asparagine synthase (glutamine-hydrolysing)
MCGIAGIIDHLALDPSFQLAVRKMTRSMVHRGPDEEGFYDGERASFGVRRLRVQDLTAGSQPFTNEREDLFLIANAEVYGFRRLRARLQSQGHKFKTDCDVEVILHAYEEYGLEMFDHIDGMFAFALWDDVRNRLIIARDRFGVKPLFFTMLNSGQQLAFASELNALLSLRDVDNSVNPAAIDQFFELSYITYPQTIYRHIHKLAPSSYLLAECGSHKIADYWKLPANVRPLRYDDALRQLDDAISESVIDTMRSDVPVGAFLSGGLDSSTIVYHMVKNSSLRVKTFSMRFKDKTLDEGDQAMEVARFLGTEHAEIWAQPNDLDSVLQAQHHFGEPFGDPSLLPTFFLCKAASESVVVSLSGDGGDELFGGYENYCASLLAERVSIPEQLRVLLVRSLEAPKASKINILRRARKFLSGCHLPPHARHAAWRTVFSEPERRALFTSEFLAEVESHREGETFDRWKGLFAEPDDGLLMPYQHLDIRTYLPDNNLVKMDCMSMAHSLEVRVPLLNLPVVEAALRVPEALRIRGFTTKIAIRRLMSGRLPKSVVGGRKKGFWPPLDDWLRGPLRLFVNSTLSEREVRESRILRERAVRGIIEAHMSGRANFGRQIWNLICFRNWQRFHNIL